MAQDIGYDMATSQTVTTFLTGDVLDNAFDSATSTVMDLGTPTPIFIGLECIIVCASGAADLVHLHTQWSFDNSVFSGDGGSISDNSDVWTIETASAATIDATTVIPVKGRYCRFLLENRSAGTITASGSSMKIYEIFYDAA